jgi:hypothetical protein
MCRPRAPHLAQTTLRANEGTSISSGNFDTSISPSCRQDGLRQCATKFCTPRWRILPSVIGGPGGCSRFWAKRHLSSRAGSLAVHGEPCTEMQNLRNRSNIRLGALVNYNIPRGPMTSLLFHQHPRYPIWRLMLPFHTECCERRSSAIVQRLATRRRTGGPR